MDYNFLLNMRFSASSGPIDLAKGTWSYSGIDFSEPGRFTGESCKFIDNNSILNKVSGKEIYFSKDTPFTLSFWIRFDTDILNSDRIYIIKYGNSEVNCICIENNYFELIDANGNILKSNNILNEIRSNEWNHICFVRKDDLTTGVFINGTISGSYSSDIGAIYFGDYDTHIGTNLIGNLDDIAFCEGAIQVYSAGTMVNVTMVQDDPNQTMHVYTPSKKSGTDHTSSFTVLSGTAWEAEVIPKIGYNQGEITASKTSSVNENDKISVPNDYLSNILNPDVEEDSVDWEDKEIGISKYDDIIKLTEWKRFNAYDRIYELQNGLTPYVLKGTSSHVTDTYFLNGEYHIYRDYKHINITIQGIQDNTLFSTRENKRFVSPMEDCYNNGYTTAFLLFIDGKLVPWSDIVVTRSDNHLTLTIKGYNYRTTTDSNLGKVRILCIPFDICYSESGKIDSDAQLLYHFTKEGLYGGNDIIIGSKGKNTRIFVYDHYRSFSNFLPDVDVKYKLTESNFTVFDPDGKFLDNPSITVPYSGNVFNLLNSVNTEGYSVIICFNENNCHSEDNILRLKGNTNFVRFITAGKSINGENKTEDLYGPRPGNIPDFPINTLSDLSTTKSYSDNYINSDIIGVQFNFRHSFDSDYNTNINNSIDYIFDYDKNKYDKIYESESPLVIVPMDISKIIKNRANSEDGKTITISRNIFDDREETSQTYAIIFINGLIPDWYDKIIYTNESISWKTPDLSYSDTFEVAYFRFIRNEIIPLNLSNGEEGTINLIVNDQSEYFNLPDFYIDKDDILIYTDKKGSMSYLPIRYTVDEISKTITLEDNKYLQTGLYMGSINQFRYKRIPVNRETNKIDLPEEFKTCYNTAKFFIFVNGRLLNSSLYRLVIPKMSDSRIKDKSIYTLRTLKVGDTLDVFYYGGSCINKVNYNGDLVFKTMKVYSTKDNQDDFIIPLPFKGFNLSDTNYSGFVLIKDSLVVEDNKYQVYEKDGVYHLRFLDWQDRVFVTGDPLTFIFPYYKSDWDLEDKISDTNSMEFITRSTIVTQDGISTITFQPDILGDVTDTRYIYIFVDSELINSDYYYIENANTIQFTFPLEANSEVTMIIETDRYTLTTNNVGLKFFTLPIDTVGQNIYTLPYDKRPNSYIFFRNGRYVDSDSYSINDNTLILHYNYNDFTPHDNFIGICSVDTSSDFNTINFYQYHISMVDPDKIDIPNYTGTTFNKNNIILFINGELVNNNYYNITANTIYLNEGIGEVGYDINVVVAYKTLNSNTVQCYPSFASTNFNRVEVKAEYDGQQTFAIPNPPYSSFSTDYKFILLLRGMFIPEYYYQFNEDKTEIILENYDNIKTGDVLSFLFCTNYGFGYIDKTEYTIPMPANKVVTLPPLFGNSLNLLNRMMVFYGSTYIDQSRYQVDNINRQVHFDDSIKFIESYNRLVTFVFFYTGNSDTGIVGYLPESGYMYFDDKQIDRNVNKNMYLMFINGKKVLQKNILDVTNFIKKVTSDIKSRYGLEIMVFSPKIVEFYGKYKELHKVDQYTLTIPESDNQKVYVLCNNILHTSTFKTEKGSQYSAYAIGNKGYIAGIVTPYEGIVNSDINFSVSKATQGKLVNVRIIQKDHQQISVTCNGRTYTSTFQELLGANFTVSIKATDNGYIPGKLNITSGSIYDGLSIEAEDPTMQQIYVTIENENLNHQTLVTDVYEMNKEKHSIYYNSGTIGMDYEANVIFFAKAESGYDVGTKVGPFEMDVAYVINRSIDNLIIENVKGPYVVSGKIVQTNNQTIYVTTKDTNGNIHTYTSDFIAKKGVEYTITAVADKGYNPGNIITNTNVTNGVMNMPLSVTITPASLKETDDNSNEIKYIEKETGYIKNDDPIEDGMVRIYVNPPENKNEAILVETKNNLFVNENTDVNKGEEITIYLKSTDGAPIDKLCIGNIIIDGYKYTLKVDNSISCYCIENGDDNK